MSIHRSSGRQIIESIGAAALALLLSACESATSPYTGNVPQFIVPPKVATPAANALRQPGHAEAQVYVANFYTGDAIIASFYPSTVRIYPSERQDPKPIGTIVSGVAAAADVWIDAAGTLYVSNDFAKNDPYSDTVTEYARGSIAPNKILTGLVFPGPLVVDSHGTVFVKDLYYMDVYEHGSTVPTRMITGPGAGGSGGGMTVDAAGNVYSENLYGSPCHSDVIKIPPNASMGRAIGVRVAGCADGLALDAGGNMYVGYYGDNNVSAINVYRPGAHTPFRRILKGVNAPFGMAFDRDGSLYVPNDNNNNVTVYAPGADKPSITISSNIRIPFGVAILPAAPLPHSF